MSEDVLPHMLLVVAREQRGWTQRELSDHSGVSKSRVHRMETGYWDKSPVADVQAVCTALELAPEALIAPQHQVQSRWQGRMGVQWLSRTSWPQLPETLGICAKDMRRYRPEVQAMGLLVADHRRTDHVLYFGHATTVNSKSTVHVSPEDAYCNQLLQKVKSSPSFTVRVRDGNTPTWCPAAWRPLWRVHQHSQHGALMLYCTSDPDRIGGIAEVSSAAADVVDRGVDLLYELNEINWETVRLDHERRLQALEQAMKQQYRR